jgi:hypothetical protein
VPPVLREAGDTGGAPYAKKKIMTAPEFVFRTPKQLEAGSFQPEISSFRLHLAAEGKAQKTVRTYTEAVQWFAAAHLRQETDLTGWEEVGKQDIQRWVVWLLDSVLPSWMFYARNEIDRQDHRSRQSRRSYRSCSGSRVAQRDDGWSRRSREIRRSACLGERAPGWLRRRLTD